MEARQISFPIINFCKKNLTKNKQIATHLRVSVNCKPIDKK